MIDERLAAELKSVFPESFMLAKKYEKYEIIPGPWGIERKFSGIGIETLAYNILNTAEAFRKKYGIERAIEYIQKFSKSSVKKNESKGYHVI